MAVPVIIILVSLFLCNFIGAETLPKIVWTSFSTAHSLGIYNLNSPNIIDASRTKSFYWISIQSVEIDSCCTKCCVWRKCIYFTNINILNIFSENYISIIYTISSLFIFIPFAWIFNSLYLIFLGINIEIPILNNAATTKIFQLEIFVKW